MKNITKQQYYQLLGLQILATKHLDALNELVSAAVDITGETDVDGEREDMGRTSDCIYGNYSVDELLKKLVIKVA